MRAWLIAIAACGGGDGGMQPGVDAFSNVTLSRDCPTPTPDCTGTLDGTWMIATACYPEPAVLADCPEILWQTSGSAGGTLTFASGTFTRTGQIVQTTTGSAPTTCDCTAVDPYVQQQVANATCADTADRCSCTGTTMRPQSETATYTVAGTTLTFDNARTATFCAGAHALTLQQHLPSGDVFEVLTLTR